jgi:NAD(P)-dependent dehydrogenase (short-subunit alcohol dehydrogenase family)
MHDGGLQDQVALITGAGSGLGAAFARRLAADGAHIVVNDLSAEAAEKTAADVGGEAVVFDVVDSAAFDAAVDAVVAQHGRLDIVVNNAGIAPPPNEARQERMLANLALRAAGRFDRQQPVRALTSMSDDEWDRMIRVHLYGAFHGTRAAVRHMEERRSGAIVNIASVLGLKPTGGAAHYSVAKAAIIALTQAVAEEVAPLGVRVNAVCPGYTDTPLLSPLTDEMRSMVKMRIGMGRLAAPEEIAEVVRFLVGPESSYCSGEIISVSGGYG